MIQAAQRLTRLRRRNFPLGRRARDIPAPHPTDSWTHVPAPAAVAKSQSIPRDRWEQMTPSTSANVGIQYGMEIWDRIFDHPEEIPNELNPTGEVVSPWPAAASTPTDETYPPRPPDVWEDPAPGPETGSCATCNKLTDNPPCDSCRARTCLICMMRNKGCLCWEPSAVFPRGIAVLPSQIRSGSYPPETPAVSSCDDPFRKVEIRAVNPPTCCT